MMVRCRCRLCGKNAKVTTVDLGGKEDGHWICARCAKGRVSWLRELSTARQGASKQRAKPEQAEEEAAPPPSGMLRLSDLRELAAQSQRSLPPPSWGEPEPAPPSVRAAIRGCELFPAAPISTRTPVSPPSVLPPPTARSVASEVIAPEPLRLRHVLNLVIVAVIAASSMVIVLHVLDRRPTFVAGKVALVSAALAGEAVRDAMRPPAESAPNAFVGNETVQTNTPAEAVTATASTTAPASAGSTAAQAAPVRAQTASAAPAEEPRAPSDEPAPAAAPAPASLADAMAAAVGKPAPPAAPEADTANTAEAPASEPDFDPAAARSSMRAIAGSLGACKSSPDEEGGSGNVRVTFAPSGAATQAVVEGGGLAGTPLGSCVASRFRGARVPPFAGSPVTVRQSFTLH
jgi:hypothetical protein